MQSLIYDQFLECICLFLSQSSFPRIFNTVHDCSILYYIQLLYTVHNHRESSEFLVVRKIASKTSNESLAFERHNESNKGMWITKYLYEKCKIQFFDQNDSYVSYSGPHIRRPSQISPRRRWTFSFHAFKLSGVLSVGLSRRSCSISKILPKSRSMISRDSDRLKGGGSSTYKSISTDF